MLHPLTSAAIVVAINSFFIWFSPFDWFRSLCSLFPLPCSLSNAVRFGATAYASLGYVGLRPRSGCSRCRSGDLRVHAHARRMHIRLRCAVLRNSPRPASVRSAAAPILTALGTSGTGKRFSLLVAPYAKSRHRSRRLHGVTRRNTSSAGYSLLVLRRVSPRIRRTAVPSFLCALDSSLALLPEPP